VQLFVEQKDMSSCLLVHQDLLNKKTCLLDKQEDMASCWARRHVFLGQADMSSWDKQTCLSVEQEDMSSFVTRRRVFLFNKKTCLFGEQQEDMSSC